VKKIKFGDILIFLLVLTVAILCFIKYAKPKSGKVLVRTEDAQFVYSLSQNGTYKIPGLIGDTVIEIKDKKVRVIDSPCPNKTCIAMGWGNLLICLPNQVFISVEQQKTKGDLDAISN